MKKVNKTIVIVLISFVFFGISSNAMAATTAENSCILIKCANKICNTSLASYSSADCATCKEACAAAAPAVTAPATQQSAGSQVKLADPLGLTDTQKENPIPYLANRLIQTALGFSGVLALLAFIYGGILYLLAGVDANNVKKAKEVMKYAVIGLLIIFLSSPIVLFILKTVLQVK